MWNWYIADLIKELIKLIAFYLNLNTYICVVMSIVCALQIYIYISDMKRNGRIYYMKMEKSKMKTFAILYMSMCMTYMHEITINAKYVRKRVPKAS